MSPTAAASSPWRISGVAAFALGRTAGVLGAQILSVTVGWQLYEATGSAWSLGLVGAFELAPVLLLMVPAGNAADRFARRNVAIAAQLLFALAALGLAAAAHWHAPVAVIYALLVAVGAARAFASPATSALLPELLKPEQFLSVNAWLASCFEIALIAGPALGGWLIAASGGATVAFVVAAAAQAGFVAALSTLPARRPTAAGGERSPAEALAGFSFIRRQPIFLAAITLDLFAVLLGGAVALLPIFAKDILAVGPVGLGWLRASPSLGALAMALALTRLPPWKRPGRVLLLTVAGFGLATVGFGLSRSMALSMACLVLAGAFDQVSVVIRWTLEQVLTPNDLRGRVGAIHYVFIGFSNELGSFESGATAALFGPVLSVVGGGLGALLVVGIVAWVWPQLARLGPLATLAPSTLQPPGEPVTDGIATVPPA